jgi:hypothetical protein
MVDRREDTRSTNMAHKLYFVGAGLSKSLEKTDKPIPLMFDFVSVLAEHLDSIVILASLCAFELADLYEWKSAEAKAIANDLSGTLRRGRCPPDVRERFRQALKNRPWESIEDLLERSFAPHSNGEANWFAQQLPQKFRYAINQLFCRIGWHVNWAPLDTFLGSQFQGDDCHTFVSFNYDLLLDRAIQKCASGWNVQRGYGFDIEYSVDPDTGTVASLLPCTTGTNISLLKPHGSLNWLLPERVPVQHGPGGTAFVDSIPIAVLGTSGEIGYFGSEDTFKWIDIPCANGPDSVEPYVAPPITAAKSQSPSFIEGVKRLEEEAIVVADEVYIIGWSLPETDKDQESLIRCSIAHRRRSFGSLTVVNRGARPGYFERIADVFGVSKSSLRVLNEGFEAFVENL